MLSSVAGYTGSPSGAEAVRARESCQKRRSTAVILRPRSAPQLTGLVCGWKGSGRFRVASMFCHGGRGESLRRYCLGSHDFFSAHNPFDRSQKRLKACA